MPTPVRAPPPIQEGRPSPSHKARWRCTTTPYLRPQASRTNQPQVQYTAPIHHQYSSTSPIKANCPQCQLLHRPAPLARSILHQYWHWYRHRYQYQYNRGDRPHPSKPDRGAVLPQGLHMQLTISGSLSVSSSISPKLRSRTGAARHSKAHRPTQGLTALSSAAPSFSCMSCDRLPKAAVNQHRPGPGRRLFQQST